MSVSSSSMGNPSSTDARPPRVLQVASGPSIDQFIGNTLAQRILSNAWDALAEGICQVIVLLCPRRFVIGGGVSLMGEELLFEPLRAQPLSGFIASLGLLLVLQAGVSILFGVTDKRVDSPFPGILRGYGLVCVMKTTRGRSVSVRRSRLWACSRSSFPNATRGSTTCF